MAEGGGSAEPPATADQGLEAVPEAGSPRPVRRFEARVVPAFTLALTGLILAVILGVIVPAVAVPVSAAFALAGGLLGLFLVRRTQLVLCLILLGVGAAALALALALGARPSLTDLTNINQDIIGMLASVSFLGLLARGIQVPPPRLTGTAAVWRTAGVTHLLGSIINMSAVTIVGDHLKRGGTLRMSDAVLISRAYSTGAFWSPFWGGMAAVLVFAPTLNLPVVMLAGIVPAAAIIALSVPKVLRMLGDDLPGYHGFSLNWQLVRIPLIMLVSVFGLHLLLPTIPVTRLVALCAVVVTIVFTAIRRRGAVVAELYREGKASLPNVRGEVTLFVAAGVMAIGISALLRTVAIQLPFQAFDVPVAWLCVLVITAFVLVGVHPVITLGLIAAVLAPLQPQPTLFAVAILLGWASSPGVGPLSGLAMYLQGRYGVDPMRLTRHNLGFAVAVIVLAAPVLCAVALVVGVPIL